MGKFLLIGPLSMDTIIKGTKKTYSIGGAVYYQSRVFSALGIKHTALTTLSKDDESILNHFPQGTDLFPLFKEETVKFENNYPDINRPNYRVQRSNAPEIPITSEDIQRFFFENEDQWDGVLLGPLLPTDIPIETVEYFYKKSIPIYLGAQGYLREFEECNLQLKPVEKLKKILKMVEILFLDQKESKALLEITENDLSLHEIGRVISDKGPQEVVITCGDRGSYIYSGKDNVSSKIKAYTPFKLRDPTGLGDTYMAAYLARKKATDNCVDCGNFAAMVSTIKLESKNGFNKSAEYVNDRLYEYNSLKSVIK